MDRDMNNIISQAIAENKRKERELYKNKDRITRLGIFGGTFNPIHTGHLLITEMLKDDFGLQKVIFVPAAQPPHKLNADIASADDRLRMVELALMGNPDFVASRVEMERVGPSYTIDTLRHFRNEFGNGVQMFFIAGADNLTEILTWRNSRQIFEESSVIFISRPGYFQGDFDKIIRENSLLESNKERIFFFNQPMFEISSTQIRKRLKEKKSSRYIIPSCVEEYICNYKLYI